MSASTPLVLYRAAPADAAIFSAVARETFSETYAVTSDPANLERHLTREFSEARQRGQLEDPAIVVLAAREPDANWAGFTALRTGTTAVGLRAIRPIEIERFYIRSEWHGRGASRFLMDAACAHGSAQGHDAIWLQVWEHNARARRFYEKCGYLPVGTKPFHFGDLWETDIVYERRL